MPYIRINNFKGINEYVDFAELPKEYAQQCINLDPDQTLGRLIKRKGYTKKYATSFTNIISAYEAKLETSGEVILIVNDNGTFKYFKDGTYVGVLSTPGGSAIDATFKNDYFAWKDSIRMTTGNGSTNHILWFGYTKRDTADNDGLFGDAIDDNGTYRFMRQQMIPQGIYANVRKIISIGGYYYVLKHYKYDKPADVTLSKSSVYLEKRDSNYQLVDIINPLEKITGYTPDNPDSNMQIATDGTYLYVCAKVVLALFSTKSYRLYKINPSTLEVVAEVAITGNLRVTDLAANSTSVYAVSTGQLEEFNNSLVSQSTTTSSMANCYAVYADDSNVYTGNARTVQVRDVADLPTVDNTSSTLGGTANDYIFSLLISDSLLWVTLSSRADYVPVFYGTVYALNTTTLATSSSYTHAVEPSALFEKSAGVYRVVSAKYGTIQEPDSADSTYYPFIVGINARSEGIGSITDMPIPETGTYFYKVSIVDRSGQEYALSDPAIIQYSATNDVYRRTRVTLSCPDSDTDYHARISSFKIYRAYNSISEDEQSPQTNYKFLREININDTGWEYDATNDVYYFSFLDTTKEEFISDITFEESSGISDNVKPRYVNGKYMTWFNDELHLANVNVGGRVYKNLIVRSSPNQPDAISFYNTYLYQEDSDEIFGITNTYNRAVVLKEKRIGLFFDDKLEQEFYPGISSESGYYKHNNDIFYLNSSGVYALTGNTHQRINDPIVTTYGSISDYTDGCMYYFDDRDRLIISFPGEESFINSLRYNTWTIYNNHSFKGYFKNDSGQYIGYSSTYFYQLFYDGDDDGTDITVTYESPLLSMENIEGVDNEFYQIQRRLAVVAAAGGTFLKCTYTNMQQAVVEGSY